MARWLGGSGAEEPSNKGGGGGGGGDPRLRARPVLAGEALAIGDGGLGAGSSSSSSSRSSSGGNRQKHRGRWRGARPSGAAALRGFGLLFARRVHTVVGNGLGAGAIAGATGAWMLVRISPVQRCRSRCEDALLLLLLRCHCRHLRARHRGVRHRRRRQRSGVARSTKALRMPWARLGRVLVGGRDVAAHWAPRPFAALGPQEVESLFAPGTTMDMAIDLWSLATGAGIDTMVACESMEADAGDANGTLALTVPPAPSAAAAAAPVADAADGAGGAPEAASLSRAGRHGHAALDACIPSRAAGLVRQTRGGGGAAAARSSSSGSFVVVVVVVGAVRWRSPWRRGLRHGPTTAAAAAAAFCGERCRQS